MQIDSFTAAFGTDGGRVVPVGWLAPEGGYVFALGSLEGLRRELNTGDFVEVMQKADTAAGSKLLRFQSHVIPRTPVAGETWRVSLMIDGVEYTGRDITRERSLVDFGAVLRPTTTMTIAFRLALTVAGGVPVEVPLPCWMIDAMILDTDTDSPLAINRNPEPGDIDVPVATMIELDIADPSDTGLANAKVYVNDVLACDNGAFSAGFDGPGSNYTVISPKLCRIVIDPTTSFDPQAVVTVRVVGMLVGGVGDTLDTTYAFTTVDTIAPRVTKATAVARKRVRVEFSESIRQDDPTSIDDALNPSNWLFTLQSTSLEDGLPAVPILVASVDAFASNAIEITTDIDITPGAIYQVSAANVADTAGNPVVPPNHTALFVGFEVPQPVGRSFELIDMLPEMNVEEDVTQDLHKFIACLQEPTDLLVDEIDAWTDIIDPDKAPEACVDAMLADLGNPFDFELTLTDKRRLVRVLVPMYRLKGTQPGIINAIRFFVGVEVTISRPAFEGVWLIGFDELGVDTTLGTSDAWPRFSFNVVSPITLTDEQRTRITKIANYMRGGREHLLAIIEPTPPPAVPNHVELGLSELGSQWILH